MYSSLSVPCAIIGRSWTTPTFLWLHRVQNDELFAKLQRRQHHSVDLLKDIQLPVRGTLDYKIAVLCHKAVKLQQPSYLTGLYSRHIVLRSSTSLTYCQQ